MFTYTQSWGCIGFHILMKKSEVHTLVWDVALCSGAHSSYAMPKPPHPTQLLSFLSV